MANKPEIALGEAVASRSAFPGALDDYRARFTDHWAPYGKALQSLSSPVAVWRPGPYPSVLPPLSNWEGIAPTLELPPSPLTGQGWRASSSPSVELPAQIVHAYPQPQPQQPRPSADSASRPSLDAPEARQGVVSGEGEAASSASADPTPSRTTARARAVAATREAAYGAKLDLVLKLFHTTSTATTAKEQAVGYLSAIGSTVGTLGGKALGAAVPHWGQMAAEVSGIALGMAGDKLGARAGAYITNPGPETAKGETPSTPTSTQPKPEVDPYSTMTGSVKDALTTAAVVGGGYAGWEMVKRRYATPGAMAANVKGVAENLKALKIPVASMFIEAGAKAAYTYGTAQTREDKWSGYGGAAGGLILGGALGAAGSLLGPVGTTIGMSVGNFLGDQVGSAVGRYLATRYQEPSPAEQTSVARGRPRRRLPEKANGTSQEQDPERGRSSGPPSPLRLPGLMAQISAAAGASSQQRPSMLALPGSTPDSAAMGRALVRDLMKPPQREGKPASAAARQGTAATTAEPAPWQSVTPDFSLLPGVVPSIGFGTHGASHTPAALAIEPSPPSQKSSRPTSVTGLPKVTVQASTSAGAAVTDRVATSSGGEPSASVSRLLVASAIGKRPPPDTGRTLTTASDRHPGHLPATAPALGWPAAVPGFSAMPGLAPLPIRFAPAVEVQMPATQLSVPPQGSVLPDAPTPAQPAIAGGSASGSAAQPISFTTNIPITLQGAAVAHDQLATDLELAVRRVLEERQRADEARLADPLRQF